MEPLLNTKFYRPRPRAGAILRPRLTDRLDEGLSRKVTLITATPGSGKSTLLASWLEQAPAGLRQAAAGALSHRAR